MKTIVMNLKEVIKKPRTKRRKFLVSLVKKLAIRHSKAKDVKIDPNLNKLLNKLPNKIIVKLDIKDNSVTVLNADNKN
jgi:ribosomal protein L31E